MWTCGRRKEPSPTERNYSAAVKWEENLEALKCRHRKRIPTVDIEQPANEPTLHRSRDAAGKNRRTGEEGNGKKEKRWMGLRIVRGVGGGLERETAELAPLFTYPSMSQHFLSSAKHQWLPLPHCNPFFSSYRIKSFDFKQRCQGLTRQAQSPIVCLLFLA